MNEAILITYSEAGEHFGVSRVTISDLVAKLGLTPKPMTNGKAKGLNRSDLKQIAKCLGVNRRHSEPASASS